MHRIWIAICDDYLAALEVLLHRIFKAHNAVKALAQPSTTFGLELSSLQETDVGDRIRRDLILRLSRKIDAHFTVRATIEIRCSSAKMIVALLVITGRQSEVYGGHARADASLRIHSRSPFQCSACDLRTNDRTCYQ
jgi:hypothetical protein